jgi:hypothetical protein
LIAAAKEDDDDVMNMLLKHGPPKVILNGALTFILSRQMSQLQEENTQSLVKIVSGLLSCGLEEAVIDNALYNLTRMRRPGIPFRRH